MRSAGGPPLVRKRLHLTLIPMPPRTSSPPQSCVDSPARRAAVGDSQRGLRISLAFWVCLFVSVGLYALVALSPKLVRCAQRAEEFAQMQQHLCDLRRQIARSPQDYLRIRNVSFKQSENSRRVADIANVHHLPRRAQENAGPPRRANRPHAKRQSPRQSRFQKRAPLHRLGERKRVPIEGEAKSF